MKVANKQTNQTKLQYFLSQPVPLVSTMRHKAKNGDLFGLELECEGAHVDGGVPVPGWEAHADGSLRDRHGQACEWVFAGPVRLPTAKERVVNLFKSFAERKSRLVCSNRTSTHVHFNMGDKSVYQLINTFILFTLFEGIFDKYCGEDREGNLFCLSSRHAERQVKWVEDSCFIHGNLANWRENFRYCSLNLAAINKFGTIEFRAMRGLDNKEDVLDWLNILNEFTQYTCYEMRNPVDLVQSVSIYTPVGFMRKVFSADAYAKLTRGMTDDYINRSVYEGLRLVQMLCYKIGTEFDQVRLAGRDYWASLAGEEEKKGKGKVTADGILGVLDIEVEGPEELEDDEGLAGAVRPMPVRNEVIRNIPPPRPRPVPGPEGQVREGFFDVRIDDAPPMPARHMPLRKRGVDLVEENLQRAMKRDAWFQREMERLGVRDEDNRDAERQALNRLNRFAAVLDDLPEGPVL